jgi:F-type H+-transporting ATPase subunit epsilon
MSTALHLIVTTPLEVVAECGGVMSLRAEDSSGDFGILPGHADFLTVIDSGVLRWRVAGRQWRYCALRGGVLTVSAGSEVRVACREAICGDDLAVLKSVVEAQRDEALDAARRSRVQSTRLHARAIRQLAHQLAADGDALAMSLGDLP